MGRIVWIGLWVSSALLGPRVASAEAPQPGSAESPFSAEWSLTVASRYLFQGLDYSDGKAVLNPELAVKAGPLTAKLWGNHDLDRNVSDEHDLSLLHEWPLGKASLTTGYTYLWYPHREGWDPSQEVYVESAIPGALNPSVSVHWDIDRGTGTYSALGISHSLDGSAGSLSMGFNLFHQSGYYDATGIPSIELNVNASRTFGAFSMTPSISRFLAWENGDFREENAVKSAWVFSFQVSQDL